MTEPQPLAAGATEILIVEDSRTQAEQLSFMLEQHGYRTTLAYNGREALQFLAQRRPTLVISDVVMPEMDGYQLCQAIQSDGKLKGIPFILVTSLTEPTAVLKALECGASSFFTKPYEEGRLLSRIRFLLTNPPPPRRPEQEPGLDISFAGEQFHVTAERRQILDLLLSTYETAVEKNLDLTRTQDELRDLNETLKQKVRERTAELEQLNKTLEQRVEEETAKNREKDHILIHQSRCAAMGEMIHNIAHQWRQPLNALGLVINNIKDDYLFNELTQESLEDQVGISQRLLQQMSSTIDEFSNFFKPDREQGTFKVEAAIENALFIMQAAFEDGGIEVVRNLDPAIRVDGYYNQFSQCVLNILANAKEAIGQRNISDGRITLTLGHQGNNAVLTIEDNGGGIPADVLPKIFDPYFTTKDKGTGIGLFMTKMIIEHNMAGTIEAFNKGEGASIRIVVPLTKKIAREPSHE